MLVTIKLCAAILVFSACLALSGCSEQRESHMSANLSLVEIGERSLETADRYESAGNLRDANISYRRALWAFGYHEKLTGEQPLLLDEAEEGARRTAPPKR